MGSRDARCEIMCTLYEHSQCRDSDVHWGTPSIQSLQLLSLKISHYNPFEYIRMLLVLVNAHPLCKSICILTS